MPRMQSRETWRKILVKTDSRWNWREISPRRAYRTRLRIGTMLWRRWYYRRWTTIWMMIKSARWTSSKIPSPSKKKRNWMSTDTQSRTNYRWREENWRCCVTASTIGFTTWQSNTLKWEAGWVNGFLSICTSDISPRNRIPRRKENISKDSMQLHTWSPLGDKLDTRGGGSPRSQWQEEDYRVDHA